ncbi:GDYXXLXY domain-containing protein, partial [Acinetobacter baumannii]
MAQKEMLLKEGQLVLLPLAPVDPRSLMQGDYMALRY